MGKPIDKNKPTRNLDELLGHLNSDSYREGDDLDAFEQEALEGFATLDSAQEAVEMKQRLDKRMEEKLAEKRKPLFIYWSAAAGIALILGLVFLMRTNSDLKSESGLADNTVADEKLLERTENNAVAPPAELKQEETGKKSGAIGAKGNSQSQTTNADQLVFKQGPMQKELEEQMNNSAVNESPVSLAEPSDGEKDADKKAEDTKRSDNAKMDDAIAGNKNQSVPGYNNASGAGAQNNKDANNEKTLANVPAKSADARDEEESEPKATEYFTSRKLKKEKEKAAGGKAETKPAAETESKFESSTIKNASLSIKESELNDKITKFLSDKDYKRSFVCTLTINSDDKVESVVFQNPELFRKGEQKEISDFFKKLKCFKNHEFAVYSTYVVNYKAQ